jgi:hypothetical protein
MIMPVMDGVRIRQVWVGMLVFHVGASLLLSASCGFYIGLLLEACLWTEHSRTMDYYGWAWASYTDIHMHGMVKQHHGNAKREQRAAPV